LRLGVGNKFRLTDSQDLDFILTQPHCNYISMKPLKKRIILLCTIIIVFSCRNPNDEVENIEAINLKYNNYKIDTLQLSPPSYSGVGMLTVFKDTLFLFDRIFGTLSTFDKSGKFYRRHLGLGKGPKELEGGHLHAILPNGEHAFLADFGIWYYNSMYEKKRFVQFDWDCDRENLLQLEKTPAPEKVCSYGYKWGFSQQYPPFLYTKEDKLIIPVSFEHPKMNAFAHQDYYKQTFMYANLDIKESKVKNLLVKRPTTLIKKGIIPNFDFAQIVNDSSGHLIVSYATEPHMEIYSAKGELLKRFGIEGQNMKINYPQAQTTDYEKIEASGYLERESFGWYDGLFMDTSNQYILRNYYKGVIKNKKSWGLQVYDESYTLIADLEIAHYCRIIGKIGSEYVATGVGAEDTPLYVYKLQLLKKNRIIN